MKQQLRTGIVLNLLLLSINRTIVGGVSAANIREIRTAKIGA